MLRIQSVGLRPSENDSSPLRTGDTSCIFSPHNETCNMKQTSSRRLLKVGFTILSGWWAFASFVTPAANGEVSSQLRRFEFEHQQMGTSFRLTFYATDRTTANVAADAAFRRVQQLDHIFSDYAADSESRRLAETNAIYSEEGVPVSDDLWRVLAVADRLSRDSDGAFDVTVGPLSKLWRRARRQRTIPKAESINRLIDPSNPTVGYTRLELLPVSADRANRSCQNAIRVKGSQPIRFDFGGIAKGYAADEALAVLSRMGIQQVLIDAGGDLRLGAAPPGREGWRIAIRADDTSGRSQSALMELNPSKHRENHRRFQLQNCGVATSGDTWQFVEANGKRYSHIIDPRTGYGLVNRTAVTVVAANGMLADGLASTVSLLGAEDGITFIDGLVPTPNDYPTFRAGHGSPQVACARVVTHSPDEPGHSTVITSARFDQLPLAPDRKPIDLNEPAK